MPSVSLPSSAVVPPPCQFLVEAAVQDAPATGTSRVRAHSALFPRGGLDQPDGRQGQPPSPRVSGVP
jgi:hypothetical protein